MSNLALLKISQSVQQAQLWRQVSAVVIFAGKGEGVTIFCHIYCPTRAVGELWFGLVALR